MRPDRLFVSHGTLDVWLAEARAEVDGETLTLRPEGHRFALAAGVAFVAEVTGEGDAAGLVGKVRDAAELEALGAEHASGSVVLGDRAYDVVDGFVGVPVAMLGAVDEAGHGAAPPDPLRSTAAGGLEAPSPPGDAELELLARFFLQDKP